jgi:hypothetical protein
MNRSSWSALFLIMSEHLTLKLIGWAICTVVGASFILSALSPPT